MGRLELVQTLKKDPGRVWNLAWHPKGEVFASCGEEKCIRIWGKDLTGKWSNKVKLVFLIFLNVDNYLVAEQRFFLSGSFN